MDQLPIVKQLKAELEKVDRELRIDCPKELRKAAAHGDFRENSEYDAAKQRQGFLQARVAHLTSRISTLASIKFDDIPKDAVGFGSRIRLEDQDSGAEVTYELVTPEEVDPRNGKISVSSPIGRALLHKHEGDEVTISLPTGVKEYVITGLETLHDLFLQKPD